MTNNLAGGMVKPAERIRAMSILLIFIPATILTLITERPPKPKVYRHRPCTFN